MNKVMKLPQKALAIELFATQPERSVSEIAIQVGVTPKTMYKWREDARFMDAVYERYMIEFGGELPAVLNAMIREAKSGNVQAGRLVLEHSGKLVKNINITVDSPFEKWLKKVEDAEVVEGEIVEEEVTHLVADLPEVEVDLPPRVPENQDVRVKKEKGSIQEQKKKAVYNLKQKEWYKWKKRAKAVGVEPLKGGRPTKGQRLAWEAEIIKRENAVKGNGNRED